MKEALRETQTLRAAYAGGVRPPSLYYTKYEADSSIRGHFEGERVGTPFPLLKCLRTHRNATLL